MVPSANSSTAQPMVAAGIAITPPLTEHEAREEQGRNHTSRLLGWEA